MSRKLVSLISAIAISAAMIPPATAEPLVRTRSVVVSYADLDLSRVEGVETLSIRLGKAVRKVCGKIILGTPLKLHSQIRACQAKQMALAVASIDTPLLTALHDGGQGTMFAER